MIGIVFSVLILAGVELAMTLNRPEDFAAIVDKIDATMFGIFGPLD